jgi:hypothetical protein
MGSLAASGAAPQGVSGLDAVFDLLDGEPLDSLLRDDAEDWGDDTGLHGVLFAGAALADEPRVDAPTAPPPPAQSAEVPLHPCLDAGHYLPWIRVCATCTPAPAEGEEGAAWLDVSTPLCIFLSERWKLFICGSRVSRHGTTVVSA